MSDANCQNEKAITNLEPGQVMEVQATDKGSTADIKAWAESTGHQYLGTVEEDEVLKHYLRKASDHESKEETKYEDVVDLNEFRQKLMVRQLSQFSMFVKMLSMPSITFRALLTFRSVN